MKTTSAALLLPVLAMMHISARSQEFAWAKNADDSGKIYNSKVAVDKWGNTYVTGRFTGTVVLGADTLASPDASDFFLAKYDSTGNVVWARGGGGIGGDQGTAVCVDDTGNVFVAGTFHNSIPFGVNTLINPDTSPVSESLFFAKFNSAGTPVWARQSFGKCQVGKANICVDHTGDIYLAGQFSDSLRLETTGLYTSGSQSYVAAYNSLGALQWVRQTKGTGVGTSGAYGVAADISGNVYTTGFIEGTDTFGSYSINSHGLLDVYITKYDASGAVSWVKRAGGSGPGSVNEGQAICIDGAGSVYLSGYFQGTTADFGTVTLTTNGMPSFFIAKFDAAGNTIWAQAPTGTSVSVSRGYDLAIDNASQLYAAGEYLGSVSFGTTATVTCDGGVHGSYDVFAVRYDTAGNARWSMTAGGVGDDAGNAVAMNAGVLVLSGDYNASSAFGPYTLADASGGGNSFIARIRDTTSSTGIRNTPPAVPALIAVYPNPASGALYVPATMGQNYRFELYTIMGTKIMAGPLEPAIDVSHLANGTYLLKLTGGSETQVQRVVIDNK